MLKTGLPAGPTSSVGEPGGKPQTLQVTLSHPHYHVAPTLPEREASMSANLHAAKQGHCETGRLVPHRSLDFPTPKSAGVGGYSARNQGVPDTLIFFRPLTPRLSLPKTKRHPIQGHLGSLSLKTKKSDPRRVTHKFPHSNLSFRTSDSLVTPWSPHHTGDALPCYPYRVTGHPIQ